MTKVCLAYSSTEQVVGLANEDLIRSMHEVTTRLKSWGAMVSIPTIAQDPNNVLYVECELHSSRISEFVEATTVVVRDLDPAAYGRLIPEFATLEIYEVREKPTAAILETLSIFGFKPNVVDRIRPLAPAPKGG